MHALLDAGSNTTLMGASGAISAVTLFYAWPYVGGAAAGLVFWWVLRKP